MAFLNPLLLLGTLAVAAPIIIHLLARRQIKKVVWAAMRFLQASVTRQQRRMDLEDLILLLLRCALLVFLALALARPAFKKGGFGAFASSGQEAALVLLDNSGSMAQSDGAVSAFQRAQKAAEEALDALPAGSVAGVWLFSDIVREAIPQPTRDFALARKIVREAVRSDRGTDVDTALRRAIDALQRQAAPSREIYLITDGQAVGWKQLAEITGMISAAQPTVKVRLVFVGEGVTQNLGVTGLRLASALAPVEEPLRFDVEVTNAGDTEARNIPVSLAIDAEPPGDEQTLESIPPGEAKRISLFLRFRQAGFHAVTAHIQPDHDPADDQRVAAVRAFSEVNVLLVDGDPGGEPRDSAVFYLRNALTPVPPEERSKYFIKARTIAPSDFESTKLSDYDAVMLAGVSQFSDAAVGTLLSYVRNGGGLVVFPGPKLNVQFYNQKLHVDHALLPARFGEAHGNPEQQEQAFHLQAHKYEHPIVSIWNEPASGTLGSARFFRAFTLVPGARKDARVAASGSSPNEDLPGDFGPPAIVLSYDDGVPAVMERSYGFGRVIQFSSSANASWNDLCVRPVYVPLIHRVLGALLARQDERLNLPVGATFSYVVSPEQLGKDVSISGPGSQKKTPGSRRIALRNGLPVLEYDETDIAGASTVKLSGADGSPLLIFATQADPAESKLKELAPADLKSLEQVATVIRWKPGTAFHSSIQTERTGSEFWLALAILATLCAIAETVLGNRFSRSK